MSIQTIVGILLWTSCYVRMGYCHADSIVRDALSKDFVPRNLAFEDVDLDFIELQDLVPNSTKPKNAYITLFNCHVDDSDENLAVKEASCLASNTSLKAADYFDAFPTRNEDELDQLRVLAYSIHKTGTEYPLIVLTSISREKFPNYYRVYLQPLRDNFNVKFVFIKPGKDLGKGWKDQFTTSAPLSGTLASLKQSSIGDFLSGRQAFYYNKFYAWKLQGYFDSLLYLEMNNLVRRNLDHLFDEPQFSGVPVVPSSFNTAVLVIKPNLGIFEDLKREYLKPETKALGDQAFMNYYFFNVTSHLTQAPHELASIYNLSTRLKNFAIWPTLKSQAAVWHLNGPIRPWDYYKAKSSEWDVYYEPTVFYEWVQARRQSLEALGMAPLHQPLLIKDKLWANDIRASALCDRYSVNYNPKRHAQNLDQFCVLIGTWDRIDLLPTIINHYQASPFVSKIYITWHNPNSRPPKDLLQIMQSNSKQKTSSGHTKPPIEFLYQKFDSLNNRFNPLDRLDTQAVLVCDDDIMVNLDDIHFVFQVWKENQNSLVGLFPRAHTYAKGHGTKGSKADEDLWLYHVSAREASPYNSYSIILTKFMFMSADYLFAYSCLMPEEVHRYVDQALNCEDIAMALLIAGMTGTKHIAVQAPIVDFGTTSGISAKSKHLDCRSVCLTDIIKILGINSLESNIEVIQRYNTPA